MKKITPTNLFLHFSKTHSVNGQLTSGIHAGINFPKGFFIHFFSKNLFISKDGIAHKLENGYDDSCGFGFLKSFPIRLLILLEIVLFLISLPFQLLLYSLIILLGFLTGIVFLPTCVVEFTLSNKNFLGKMATNRNICLIAWIYFGCSILSLLYLIAYIALIPFQIIVPELCVFLLKYHKWNTSQFDYLK